MFDEYLKVGSKLSALYAIRSTAKSMIAADAMSFEIYPLEERYTYLGEKIDALTAGLLNVYLDKRRTNADDPELRALEGRIRELVEADL